MRRYQIYLYYKRISINQTLEVALYQFPPDPNSHLVSKIARKGFILQQCTDKIIFSKEFVKLYVYCFVEYDAENFNSALLE